MWGKYLKKETFRKGPATLKFHSGTCTVYAYANQHAGFSVIEHRLQMGYSKQLMD